MLPIPLTGDRDLEVSDITDTYIKLFFLYFEGQVKYFRKLRKFKKEFSEVLEV